MRSFFSFFLVTTLCTTLLQAGDTGKLNGTVRDQNNGEVLVGANILIVGTTLGGASDLDGFYFVNRVPPGVYKVQFSMIGYRTVVMSDVQIMADLTTNLSATLTNQEVEMGAIEIVAQRPIVQKDRTSTRAIVSGETIARDLRYQDVNEVIRLQAGVTTDGSGNIHIRGGRTGGVVYQVDGIPLQNPFTRTQGGEVDVGTVQELQAHLGTFDAEYGNAADGIISVFTKDGGQNYSGRLYYQSPVLNSSPYHKKDWNLDRPEVGSLSPDQQQQYLDEVRKPDGTSAYDWVSVLDDPDAKQFLLIPMLGRFTANFSGPVPFLSPLTFLLSGRLIQENRQLPYGYVLDRTATLKLTYPVSPLFTLKGSVDLSGGENQDYDHAYKFWRWWDSGLDPFGRKGSYPIDMLKGNRELLTARHVLSSSTFYDVSVAHIFESFEEVVPDRTIVSDPVTGELIFSDYVRRAFVDGNDSGFRYGDVRYYRKTESRQFIAKANVESQIDNHHQIRSGFEINFHTLFRHRIGMPTLPNLEFFNHKPVQGAFYVQDKIEFSFMILKLGVRLDYFDPTTTAYSDPSRIIEVYTAPGGTADYRASQRVDAPRRLQISPRIGVAHPISDKTSVHFAYGHFFQIPRFYDLYRNDALSDILVNDALIGNPSLKPERTVSFEVGLQQELSAEWGLNLTAYTKDITNLTSSFYYFVGRDYSIFTNTDFGRVQGIDLTLNKSFTDLYSARFTYSLVHALGNQSDPLAGYTFREDQAHLRPNRNYFLDFDQRHKITTAFISRLPENFGPEVLGIHPLEMFSFTMILTIGSGLPYTPTSRSSDETGIIPEPNSARRPWVYNLDLKLAREFKVGDITLSAFLDIDNVFDAINTESVWTRTGQPLDEGPTSVRSKDRQANPENLGPRRAMRLGLFMDF